MTTSIYYVDASRVATNWGSAVSGGVATTNIFKLTITNDLAQGPAREFIALKFASGTPVSSAAVTAAQAETTGGAVPAVVAKKENFGPISVSEEYATLLAVSGSVTVDGRIGTVIELNLTGNVTALAITNPGPTGRVLELHFVQDATGSRTLSGVNSAIKLAGGTALTLTTTASKRDILRLRHVGAGKFVELARSLNLA
jgi:hypothetical protein